MFQKEVEMEDIVEEPLVDIDSCDLKNPLAVLEYVEDLHTYYKKMEVMYSLSLYPFVTIGSRSCQYC